MAESLGAFYDDVINSERQAHCGSHLHQMCPDVVHRDGHGDSERPELARIERLQPVRRGGRSRRHRHRLPGAGAGAGAGGRPVPPAGHVRKRLIHAENVVLRGDEARVSDVNR